MRCPLADNAAPAVSAVSSCHATPAVGSLRVPLKPGPKPRISQEQRKSKHASAARAFRKRKTEEHAALEARAKKAEDELAQSRADNVKLAGVLVRAAAEIRRLRGLLADRQVDAMVTALEAEVPRADLHGEGSSLDPHVTVPFSGRSRTISYQNNEHRPLIMGGTRHRRHAGSVLVLSVGYEMGARAS